MPPSPVGGFAKLALSGLDAIKGCLVVEDVEPLGCERFGLRLWFCWAWASDEGSGRVGIRVSKWAEREHEAAWS